MALESHLVTKHTLLRLSYLMLKRGSVIKRMSSTTASRKRARIDSDRSGKRPRHEVNDQETSPFHQSSLSCALPTPAVAGVGGKINCLNAIYFHPVKNENDYFNPTIYFSPLFVHHFFGLKEEVHGFSELLIRIFYTVDTFEVYIKVEVTKPGSLIATPASNETSSVISSPSGLTSSELLDTEEELHVLLRVLSYLSKVPYPGDFHRTEASFLQAIHSPTRSQFTPPGIFVAHLTGTHGFDIRLFECRFNDCTKMGQEFSKYHRRVEWFLHFFIDACSNIDHDRRWSILLPYVCPSKEPSFATATAALPQKIVHKRSNASAKLDSPRASPKVGTPRRSKTAPFKHSWSGYELVGVVTLYHFFSLPLCRRRVSQFLIFPHFQGRSVGLQLLEWVFNQAVEDPDVGEITVEDPAMSFGQLRDIVDFKTALRKGALKGGDFFPDGTSLAKKEDSPHGRQHKHAQKSATKKSTTQKTSAHSNDVGMFSDPEFKKRLKAVTKESARQIIRLCEILNLAKLFPHPLPLPPAASSLMSNTQTASGGETSRNTTRVVVKEISRDWRHMTHHEHGIGQGGKHHVRPHPTVITQPTTAAIPMATVSDFHTSEAMKEIRVKIKKRIRLDHLEDLGTLSANEQRVHLSNIWNSVYLSYYRTVRKIREAILQHEFEFV